MDLEKLTYIAEKSDNWKAAVHKWGGGGRQNMRESESTVRKWKNSKTVRVEYESENRVRKWKYSKNVKV